MKHGSFRPLAALAIMLAICASATPAFAQYVWLNENGVKQYSDMPPPASVPSDRILKQPASAASANTGEAPAASAQVSAETAKPPMTTAERNADFRKRRAEQAEEERKAAQQAKVNAEKARSCERANDYRAALESGQRIARTDHNGERSYLTDDQRAEELRDVKHMLHACK